MLTAEIRFVMQGKEVSLDSFVEAIVREVRASVRDEISRTFTKNGHQDSNPSRRNSSEIPRQAVSVREAARLLSISQRTVDKYVALKVIHTVRVGRRVLVPMKSVNEVVASLEGFPGNGIKHQLASKPEGPALATRPKKTWVNLRGNMRSSTLIVSARFKRFISRFNSCSESGVLPIGRSPSRWEEKKEPKLDPNDRGSHDSSHLI